MATPEIASVYLSARERIDELVRGSSPAEASTPTPTCPGWTVHGMVAHLVGTVDWVAAGRLQGLPSDEDTATQIAERADVPIDELLDTWASTAPTFAQQMAELGIWPAAIDALTHEHDLRHALGRPGERTHDDVRTVGRLLLSSWRPDRPVEVTTEGETVQVGPSPQDGEQPLALRTTWFEILRWRMGRRSRDQLAAMDWSGDPTPVLDAAVVFGPSAHDIDE